MHLGPKAVGKCLIGDGDNLPAVVVHIRNANKHSIAVKALVIEYLRCGLTVVVRLPDPSFTAFNNTGADIFFSRLN